MPRADIHFLSASTPRGRALAAGCNTGKPTAPHLSAKRLIQSVALQPISLCLQPPTYRTKQTPVLHERTCAAADSVLSLISSPSSKHLCHPTAPFSATAPLFCDVPTLMPVATMPHGMFICRLYRHHALFRLVAGCDHPPTSSNCAPAANMQLAIIDNP